ncbi:MAG TPA: hypothetical protein VL588_06750 [Bdellovibrionota bacterium]|jgi:hypothetical protein|nr:hypothetical protein [Bdellovibrionota bacterium]
MKAAIALILTLVSSSAFAQASLQIPVLIEGGDNGTPAAEINKELKKVGAPLIPTTITVSTDDDGYKKFHELDAKIETSLKALGSDYEYVSRQGELVPGENDKPGAETCYRGNAREVADLVGGLADIAYSDQLNIWGWKYKKTTVISGDDNPETNDFLNKGSATWRKWTGKGENLLILSAVGDDGDDIETSLIKPCH